MAIFPFQAQYDSMDCGPTCVYMICRAYGKHISLQHIREKAQIGKDGVNLLGISEAAESLGFRTIAAKVSIEQLANDVQLPAILHWNQNHFVVLTDVKQPGFWRKFFSKRKKGVQGKNYKFIVADPAKSIITYTEEELTKNWISDVKDGRKTGTLLMLDPTASFYEQAEAEPSKGLGFSLLYGYLKKHYKLVVNLILSLAIGSILQLILPFLTQSIVDTGVNSQDLNFVYLVLLGQLALFAGRLIVEFVRGWILLHISTRINVGIITDFLIKLMRLPISFFDTKQTGDLLQRINDHYRIESFLTGTSLNVLFSMFNIIVFSIVLAVFNVGIFLAFMLASVLYATWVIFFLKFRRKLDYQHFEMQAKEQGTTIQLIQSMQEIKLHGCEKNKRWEWERIQANLMKISMKSLALNQYQQAGAFFINEGKNILITFLSASAVINGSLTIGSMLAIQYIIGQLNSPVEQMIEFVRNFQNAKISIERLNEIHTLDDEEPSSMNLIYQLPPDVQSMIAGGKANSQSKSNRPLPQSIDTQEQREAFSDKRLDFAMNGGYENAEAITIKDLTFTYKGAGNTPVLKSLDLQIPLGKTTAIVGTSGSGKTTLLKLLLKFYDPQKGEIRIGNTNLATISHRTWRSYCGVVMQESYIFSDTIARNIAVGEERVDMAQLYYAAAVANIKEFIENLPSGFNTKIGADGLGISQGQKQRLLIARAVYKNPDFIFFDEATNSLDANNESTILNNLWSIFKNKTVVVVAHRLSTVKNADQIVVVKNGEIIEKGTHQELIALKGDYYILVKNQLELGS